MFIIKLHLKSIIWGQIFSYGKLLSLQKKYYYISVGAELWTYTKVSLNFTHTDNINDKLSYASMIANIFNLCVCTLYNTTLQFIIEHTK